MLQSGSGSVKIGLKEKLFLSEVYMENIQKRNFVYVFGNLFI